MNPESEATLTPASGDSSFPSGFRSLQIAVAFLLIVAAVSKLMRFVEIVSGDGVLSDPWLLRTVASVEALISVFILLGPPIWVRRIIFVVFGGFIFITSYAILTQRDCNCIAQFIPPWGMLLIDICIFIWAVIVKPESRQILTTRTAVSFGVIVGSTFMVFAAQRSVIPVAPVENEPIAYLLADSLIDQQWPLTSRQHPELKELEIGRWLVLVIRKDCDHCQQLVAEVFADPERHPPGVRTAMFVAGEDEWPFQFDRIAMDVRGDSRLAWSAGEPFVASPAIFHLNDGRVTKAADGQDADKLLKELF